MHLHVPRLTDAKSTVGSLILDGRVPPAVKVKDVVGAGQVQPRAAGFERKDEDRRAVSFLLKTRHQAIPLLLRRAAVQKQHLDAEQGLQIRPQHLAHRGELGEHQGLVADGECFLQHLAQPVELAGSSRQR